MLPSEFERSEVITRDENGAIPPGLSWRVEGFEAKAPTYGEALEMDSTGGVIQENLTMVRTWLADKNLAMIETGVEADPAAVRRAEDRLALYLKRRSQFQHRRIISTVKSGTLHVGAQSWPLTDDLSTAPEDVILEALTAIHANYSATLPKATEEKS